MDPLTAFSLACGVIQVVDFGCRALSMCKEMYEQGELSEYKELEGTTKHLANAQKDIRLPSTSLSATALHKPQDKELYEIATDCSAIAEELTTKLEALKVHGPRRRRDRIKMGFKAFREKHQIQELQRRLDSYRKALDTRILLGLKQQLDLFTNLDSAIQDLSQQVQIIITELSQGPKAFDELAKAIRDEHAETRDHITEKFLQYQQMQDHKEYRKRLLDSLWFNELWSREERIADAHRETFEWIFDSTGKGVGRWDNFVEWLERGKGIYWIKGKAGSGKSTLMSFLGQDSRIPESLKVWAASKSILVPKFYFWSGGTPIERSTEGLLRSLLWQILNQITDLQVSDLREKHFDSILAEPIVAWTERRLRAKLKETVQQVLHTHRLCFFIDGLDEFAGDQAGLISFIQDIVQSPGIKMCLSSRPEQIFLQTFESSAKLQLQDLTEADIQKFVMDELQCWVPQVSSMASQGSYWLQGLTRKILWKAQGVFLWVSLAVKDQIRGLINCDTFEQLEERLKSLPDEVEGIYARMLSQIDKPYRQEASIFLQIALHGDMSSLLSHVLAFHKNLDAILSSDDDMPEHELVEMSDRIRKRIAIACAGLLEVNELRERGDSEEDSEQEDSEQEDSEQEDSEQEGLIQLNDPMSRANPRTKEKVAASHSGDSASDNDDVDFGEERSSKPDDKNSIVTGKTSKLNEESQDSESDYGLPRPSPGEAQGMEVYRLDESFDVSFIHRTAVDFMRNEDAGGAFLRLNTPSGFDPRVFRVKDLLARLRLLGYHRGLRDVEIVMTAIWEAEHYTGCEQTTLCHLMDDTMWRIDEERYSQIRDRSSHWSTRWATRGGFDDEVEILELNLAEENYYTSSQPEHLKGKSRKTSLKWDFLSLAASYGLHRYVQQNLNYGSFTCDQDAATYLFYSYMLALWRSYVDYMPRSRVNRMIASLDYANEILGRDIDLSLKVNGDFTLWQAFLSRMQNVLRGPFGSVYRIPDDDLHELQNAFARTGLAFIDRGADLARNEVLRLKIDAIFDRERLYAFFVDHSVLAVLELCLTGQRELFRIREACKSAGAIFYARCSKLQFRYVTQDQGTCEEEYELSHLESSAWLDLYKRDFTKVKIRFSMEDDMRELAGKIRAERQKRGNGDSAIGEVDIESTEEHSSDFETTDKSLNEAGL